MLRDVFRFSDKRANDLMTYRRDIVVLHPTDTPEEVLRIIHEEHFSKYLLVERTAPTPSEITIASVAFMIL